MAKKSGNEFTNAKFTNAQFIGNNSSRSRYIDNSKSVSDLNGVNKQTQESVHSNNKTTLDEYTDLYKSLVGLHKTEYLDKISKNEKEHYTKLLAPNTNGFIYNSYDKLYRALEERHQKYLDAISGGRVETDVEPGKEQKPQEDSTSAIITNIYKALTELDAGQDTTINLVKQNLNLSTAMATFLVAYGKTNEKLANAQRDLQTAIDKTDTVSGKDPENKSDKKGKKNTNEFLKDIYGGIQEFTKTTVDNLVVGKSNQKLMRDVFDIIRVFQKQESVTSSIVELIMIAVREVTSFIGESITEHYQTQENTYSQFGLYLMRADDYYEQNALYNNEMASKISDLYGLELQNNVKSTEWWTKQVELLSKGFSAEDSRSAALQSIILNKVAPNLDTSSSIFMDLQQYGMNEIIHSLGGLVEATRENAGTSRITMGSMSTIVDKLAPIELYAKKGLLNEKASAMLSALEDSGMATEDALNLVTTASGVWSDVYGKLTSGSAAERLAATRILSGDYTDFADTVLGMYGQSAGMLSGVPGKGTPTGALLTGGVSSAMGYSWINAWSNPSIIDAEFQRKYNEYLGNGVSPDRAYKSLEDLLREDFLQTGDQLLENQQNNLTIATQINGFLQMMALDISKIVSYFALLLEDRDISYYTADANATLKNLEQQVKLGTISQEDYNKEVAKWKEQETKGQEQYMEYEKSKNATIGTALGVGLGIVTGSPVFGLATKGLVSGAGYLGFGGYSTDYSSINSTANQLYGAYGKVSSNTAEQQMKNAGIPGYAIGGYVKNKQLAWVAEQQPEIITPIPQLASAVMQGVNLSNQNRDYTPIITAINVVGSAIVEAIKDGKDTVSFRLDRSTGLLSDGNKKQYTSLRPIMRR